MKVMWLSHPPKKLVKELGFPGMATGGWVDGLAEKLTSYYYDECELIFVFLNRYNDKEFRGKIDLGGGEFEYIGIPVNPANQSIESRFSELFAEIKPDILHVFGTENPNYFKIVKTFNNPDRTITALQGLAEIYGRHIPDGIPERVVRGKTLRDIIRGDSILKWQRNFYKAGKIERQAVEYCKNFFGRTDFDHAFVKQINPDCNYFHCGEILRGEFYSSEKLWSYENCDKHSLFTSQAHYTLKGLHFLIEAMGILAKKYPDIKLHVGGHTIRVIPKNFKDYMCQCSYARYCWSLVKKYNLQDKITFTGVMDTNTMLQQFLKSHVYVCPSTMENSPNSLCEAKLLAMPCVASDVGGISNLMKHKEDGYMYPVNEPYMLAYYIDEIFEMKERAAELGQKARENILKLVDPKTNTDRTIEVYRQLIAGI